MSVRQPLAIAVLGCVLLTGFTSASDAATPGQVRAYEVEACSDPFLASITASPGRGVLLRLCATGKPSFLAQLLPDGRLIRKRVERSDPGPIVVGSAGEIWAVAESVKKEGGGHEARIDRIARDGSLSSFQFDPPDAVAERRASERELRIVGFVADREDGVWIATGEPAFNFFPGAVSIGGELVHVSADGAVTRFRVPEEVEPRGLAFGPDGNLWFTGVKGRTATEHTSDPGTGYIGKMTPSGAFTLFPTPVERSGPTGIVTGPDGRLWFVQPEAHHYSSGAGQIGSIGIDGSFGPSFVARLGYPSGGLAFGPEGDLWLPLPEAGLMRLTPSGQETLFPPRGEGIAVGAEGDIWVTGYNGVRRVVPGAPGIDVSELSADRATSTIKVRLACGGSRRKCAGTLDLALRVPRRSRVSAKGPHKALLPIAHVDFSVPAESAETRTIPILAKVFRLARHYRPRGSGRAYAPPVIVHATVKGGPSLDRPIPVRSLGGAGLSSGPAN